MNIKKVGIRNRISNKTDKSCKDKIRRGLASFALLASGLASACGGMDRTIDNVPPVQTPTSTACSVGDTPAECAEQASGRLTGASDEAPLVLGNLGFNLQSLGSDGEGEYAGIAVTDGECNLITSIRATIDGTTEFSIPSSDNPDEMVTLAVTISSRDDGSIDVTVEVICEEICPVETAPDLGCSESTLAEVEFGGVIAANGVGVLVGHIGETDVGIPGLFGVIIDRECIPLTEIRWFNEHEATPLESTLAPDGSVISFSVPDVTLRLDHGPAWATVQLTRDCP